MGVYRRGAGGNVVAELRYAPFGATRSAFGTTVSKYQFTGQFSNEAEFGLYFYNARWYDAYNTHFTSPDTVVADQNNTLDWDRYGYSRSNPLKYTDPSGHWVCEDVDCHGRVSDPPKNQGCGSGQSRCLGTTTFLDKNRPVYKENGIDSGNGLEDLLDFARLGKTAIEFFIWVHDYGQPAYKQIKGLGNAGPIIEGSVGFSLQFISDIPNSNLTLENKFQRASIIGIEDAITDVVSGPVAIKSGLLMAGLTSETGPGALFFGGVGYIVGNVVATQAMQNIIWNPINNALSVFNQ